mgnify:CR=1 FL=1
MERYKLAITKTKIKNHYQTRERDMKKIKLLALALVASFTLNNAKAASGIECMSPFPAVCGAVVLLGLIVTGKEFGWFDNNKSIDYGEYNYEKDGIQAWEKSNKNLKYTWPRVSMKSDKSDTNMLVPINKLCYSGSQVISDPFKDGMDYLVAGTLEGMANVPVEEDYGNSENSYWGGETQAETVWAPSVLYKGYCQNSSDSDHGCNEYDDSNMAYERVNYGEPIEVAVMEVLSPKNTLEVINGKFSYRIRKCN